MIQQVLVILNAGSQNSDYVCHIFNKHPKRSKIIAKLVALSENVGTFHIAYNALLTIGHLAASVYFYEK